MDPNVYIPELLPKQNPTRMIQVLGEDGPQIVDEADLRDWLAENQNERPPGSGPDGEWTVDDEEAAMLKFEEAGRLAAEDESGEMQQRLDEYPYDVMADMLHDQDYDFSPEGAEARQQAQDEMIQQTLDDYGTDEFVQEMYTPAFPDEEDERYFSPDDVRERLSAYEQSQKRTHDAARKAVDSSSPQGYIVHPDGYTEYFEDPKVTAQAKKDTEESERQYLKEQRQKRKDAERRGKQAPSTLGPSMTE